MPLVTAYDYHERVWNPPMPLLFQRRYGGEHHAIGGPAIRELISDALPGTGLADASGKPLPDAKVTVTLVMPAMPSMNMPEMRSSFEVPWLASHNMYMGRGRVPTPGPWTVTVEVRKDGKLIGSHRTRLSATT